MESSTEADKEEDAFEGMLMGDDLDGIEDGGGGGGGGGALSPCDEGVG